MSVERHVNSIEPMRLSFNVERDDFVRAGEASSKIKKTLLQLGFPNEMIRRVAVATYEVEMNMVIHSLGGVLSAEIFPGTLTIVAADRGPGIPSVEQAMKEGYSTAPERIREMGFGAGMGLPNMRNCANDFHITSEVDKGTIVTMTIHE